MDVYGHDIKLSADEQLADEVAKFYDDPLGYVMFMFPWDSNAEIQQVPLVEPYRSRFNCEYGPDKWACEFLDEWGEEIRKRKFDGSKSVMPIQFSTASGHGIGKSTMVAWIIKFIMDTRPYCKGVVTAGTADQLKTKTWAELGKWNRLSLTSHWFVYNAGRGAMNFYHKDFAETWRCDAQTCKEENADSFAGLHAANSTPFYIFDEASAVPDKIFEVRQGGLTDGEPMSFDFGNPTTRAGYFFENTHPDGKYRKRYITRSIDSRTVHVTSKTLFEQWIEDYGLDSDFVKVRVRGLFPDASTIQFISDSIVRTAMERPDDMSNYERANAPLVIGVDVARFGDDESVIKARLGRDCRSYPAKAFRGFDTVQLVGAVTAMVDEFRQVGLETAAIFVDGTGVGGGVVDMLRHAGYPVWDVQFGTNPVDTRMYRYTSDELWGNLRDNIKRNLLLPVENTDEGKVLREQLTNREYGLTTTGRIHLETKKDMKIRIGGEFGSPDRADALALTFFREVAPKSMQQNQGQLMFSVNEYDPFTPSENKGLTHRSEIIYTNDDGSIR